MIEGGWPFVWTAYAVTFGALVPLAAIVWLRLAHWAKESRALDAKRAKS
jgi:heme exporter protein CcmD